MQLDEIINFQIIAYSGDEGSDRIIVKAGSTETDDALVEKIKNTIRSYARVAPEVEIMSPERVDGLLYAGNRRKKMTFVDMRGTVA
ncbi:MAG TPA: hypothetical protein DDW94_11860 [Deltaproteobacteria bacterium]|nr:MAG: hypothetical protein A3I81_08240 [Deltaproteobacteria bacterium RIFCSPLOWO2_02_FULL_55_12]OIJ72753.1 MAG: hypothetical protein A2V21_312995 [Deltaproteobacteria bacterium GWC2_55_46]HBG47665.1 hypothetical protein [Deltaproteobacteria bacterium]HCY10576.1 hypothetical protein [Deltaproteobacteria bacterium]